MNYPKYQVRVNTINDGFVPYQLVEPCDRAEPYLASVYMHNYGDSWTCLEDHNNFHSAYERAELLNQQFEHVVSIVKKRAFSQNDIVKLAELFDVDAYLNYVKNEEELRP